MTNLSKPQEGPAFEFARNMGIGINIGNTLDAIKNLASDTPAGETGWGNPPVTREFIRALKNYGYTTIRLPVTWAEYIGPAPDFQIARERMDRVEEAVNWILDEDLYCILNLHHDVGKSPKSWILNAAHDLRGVKEKFAAVWKQIAARFCGASNKLILESMNEIGFDDLWDRHNPDVNDKKPRAFGILNELNQDFVDTVRGSGGGNASRFLLISGYWTDIDLSCDALFKMPQDILEDRLLLSVHYYTPAGFCILNKDASWGKNQIDWGSREDYAQLFEQFDKIKRHFIDRGVPVILGEYGVSSGETKVRAARTRWIAAVTQACLDNGVCPVFWDTGNDIKRSPLNNYAMSGALKDALALIKVKK